MKPIAQTFLISEPNTGIEGVFVTQIHVYFKSVSSNYGISLEIRTVENGFPTTNRIVGSGSRLSAQQVRASDDGTLHTAFTFLSPPFLQVNTQYAFVLIPDGGNDEYLIWTAEIGGTDAATGAPIYINNQLGNLFISSNDLVFTPVITESIKYDLYIADFIENSASIYLAPIPTDFIKINNLVGSFYNQEKIWVSNSNYTSISTYSNSMIVVPNTSISDLTVGNWIYVATLDRSSVNFRQVSSIINTTALTVSSNITFTNTSCMFGKLAGNTALYGILEKQLQFNNQDELELVVKNYNSNTSLNFSTFTNQFIFGAASGASANISSIANKQYDSITPHINFISSAQTAVDFSYRGYSNGISQDSSYTSAIDNIPNEFVDKERLLLSRSNALANASIGTNNSLIIKAELSTSNNLTAPYIDRLGTSVTITYNSPTSLSQLTGYHLNITGASNNFLVGETVTQGSTGGTVDGANSSYLRVINSNGAFTNTTITGGTSGATANVTVSTYFDETLENGYYGASRYISKNVILADKQDAEDLISYLTIYRPIGTQFLVYGKFLNGSDTDSFSDKSWSYMPEIDVSTSLFSSTTNRDDVIEAQFGLPTSVMIDTDSAVTGSTTANVTVLNSAYYNANTYVYLKDNGANGYFNVRYISSIPNSSVITLSSNPSFTSSNVTVGYIPGIQSRTGAFLYANNNGIIRYVTNSDVVYDSYKQFAIKIVPLSNNSVLVPIMKNMRALALQI
jgi:hypothetical protein